MTRAVREECKTPCKLILAERRETQAAVSNSHDKYICYPSLHVTVSDAILSRGYSSDVPGE